MDWSSRIAARAARADGCSTDCIIGAMAAAPFQTCCMRERSSRRPLRSLSPIFWIQFLRDAGLSDRGRVGEAEDGARELEVVSSSDGLVPAASSRGGSVGMPMGCIADGALGTDARARLSEGPMTQAGRVESAIFPMEEGPARKAGE